MGGFLSTAAQWSGNDGEREGDRKRAGFAVVFGKEDLKKDFGDGGEAGFGPVSREGADDVDALVAMEAEAELGGHIKAQFPDGFHHALDGRIGKDDDGVGFFVTAPMCEHLTPDQGRCPRAKLQPGTRSRLRSNDPEQALCESRVREIRMSGLKREKEVGGHWPCALGLPSLFSCQLWG